MRATASKVATRALHIIGPEGEAFVLTHAPAAALERGTPDSDVPMQVHLGEVDGVPLVQLSAPGVPNLLHLIVPLDGPGLPLLLPPKQGVTPFPSDF